MKKLALALLCILAAAAGAAVSEYQNPRILPMLRPTDDQSAVAKAPIAMEPGNTEAPAPTPEVDNVYPEETVSPMEIRELFEKMDFDTLTARLEKYQTMFEEDFRYEYHVYDAFQAFDTNLPKYEVLLSAWQDAAPESFAPHLARAIYYQELGYNSRGAEWATETTKSQFAGMDYHYQRAEQEALEALNLNPNAVRAVTILMNIRMNYSDRKALIALKDHATRLSPYAMLFRLNYMFSLLPRWGGSYNAMDNYVRSCEKYFRFNPRLAVLKGYKFSDMGDYYRRKEDYPKALAMYNQALSFGPDHNYLRDRGRIYYRMKDYRSAMADLDQAVSIRPTITANYNLRSKIYYATGNFEASLQDLDIATQIKPTDSHTLEDRQWCCNNLMQRGHQLFKTDKNGSVEKYSLALRYNSEFAEVWYWRGVAYSNLGRYEESRADIKHSIELDPAHFESVRMIDNLLARERKWDEIIEYWNAFLLLNPTHADALMERSGTHYHNGNMELALRDLKRSCELGNRNACRQYKKMNR